MSEKISIETIIKGTHGILSLRTIFTGEASQHQLVIDYILKNKQNPWEELTAKLWLNE